MSIDRRLGKGDHPSQQIDMRAPRDRLARERGEYVPERPAPTAPPASSTGPR